MTLYETPEDFPLSKAQIIKYLEKIHVLPQNSNHDIVLPPPTLENLTHIQNQHAKTIPFGALSLHYHKRYPQPIAPRPLNFLNPNSTRSVSIDPLDIFEKLVVLGREGYCYENNGLLRLILEFLGFDCAQIIGRIVNIGTWKKNGRIEALPATHTVIVVILEGNKYLVDIGYGARSPSHPILIGNSEATIGEGLMQHRALEQLLTEPGHFSNSQLLPTYLLQTRTPLSIGNSAIQYKEWQPCYIFNLAPIYYNDLVLHNFYSSSNPDTIFNKHLIVTKYLDNGQVVLLDNKVTLYKNGQVIEQKELNNEKERRDAFLKYFSISIPEDYKEHLPSEFGYPLV